MMKIACAVIGLVVLDLFVNVGPLRAQNTDQNTAEQIKSRAWNIAGLDRLPEKSGLTERFEVKMVVGRDSISPFLTEKIDGQHIWRASCEKVLLQFDKWGVDHPIPSKEYDLEVFLDSATGQMLKIRFLNDKHDTSLVKKPSAQSAERQLKYMKRAVPSGDPPTSLAQVLGSLPRSPLPATEIVAYYWLMELYGDEVLHPVWEVYLYGSPSFRFKPYPGESLSDRSYVRWLFNADTGLPLIGTYTPKP